MHGRDTLESYGWSGTAPGSLISPAKWKHMMAKGRQLPAFMWLAPMQYKLLSFRGTKCVSIRHGDTYNCCVEILSALSHSLSPPPLSSLSDLLLPDATISCSLYFSSWMPFILPFTVVDGIFPGVRERELCPWLWEKKKDGTNLTPRAYPPRVAVFVRTLWRHDRICEWEYQHWEEHCWALVCNYCLPPPFLAHAVPRSIHLMSQTESASQIAENFFRQH